MRKEADKRDLPKPTAHIPLMCNDVYWVDMQQNWNNNSESNHAPGTINPEHLNSGRLDFFIQMCLQSMRG